VPNVHLLLGFLSVLPAHLGQSSGGGEGEKAVNFELGTGQRVFWKGEKKENKHARRASHKNEVVHPGHQAVKVAKAPQVWGE